MLIEELSPSQNDQRRSATNWNLRRQKESEVWASQRSTIMTAQVGLRGRSQSPIRCQNECGEDATIRSVEFNYNPVARVSNPSQKTLNGYRINTKL